MSLTQKMNEAAKYARVADHLGTVAFCYLEDVKDSYSVRYGKRCIIAANIPDEGTAVAATSLMNDAVGKCQALLSTKVAEIAKQDLTLFEGAGVPGLPLSPVGVQ